MSSPVASMNGGSARRNRRSRERPGADDEDVICEEIMLDAFAPDSTNALDSQEAGPDADAKKICIIGNSHVAALREALKTKAFVDRKMDIVFWGFAGKWFFEIKFENGVLNSSKQAKSFGCIKRTL